MQPEKPDSRTFIIAILFLLISISYCFGMYTLHPYTYRGQFIVIGLASEIAGVVFFLGGELCQR